jgi:hypothetical protein
MEESRLRLNRARRVHSNGDESNREKGLSKSSRV